MGPKHQGFFLCELLVLLMDVMLPKGLGLFMASLPHWTEGTYTVVSQNNSNLQA